MKITYIVSNIDYALEFDWIANGLIKNNFQLQFIFINQKPGTLHQQFVERGIQSEELIYTSKKSLFSMVLRTRKLLKKFKPDVVHTHLFEGSLVGLLSAKLAGIKHRLYTRHHSNYHHVYAPKAIKFDKRINKWSTGIISISDVVTKVLTEMENVDPSKIILVEHGLNPANFRQSSEADIAQMKAQYDFSEAHPVIGCISRFDKWKGVNYILDAFSELLNHYPQAILLLAYGGGGDDKEAILNQIDRLQIGENIRLITFERNVNTLYDCMDVFVHTPVDELSEAFGQIYIEALYKKVPIVATRSGVGHRLLVREENVVDFKDASRILEKLIVHLNMSDDAKAELLEANFNRVKDHYIFERKEKQIIEIYKRLS